MLLEHVHRDQVFAEYLEGEECGLCRQLSGLDLAPNEFDIGAFPQILHSFAEHAVVHELEKLFIEIILHLLPCIRVESI
jgi:hypothetical protein